MGGFGMGFGWIFWILILAAIIWAIIRFSSQSPRRSGPSQQSEDALEILKKRYARGEIGKEEFEEKKKTLGA